MQEIKQQVLGRLENVKQERAKVVAELEEKANVQIALMVRPHDAAIGELELFLKLLEEQEMEGQEPAQEPEQETTEEKLAEE